MKKFRKQTKHRGISGLALTAAGLLGSVAAVVPAHAQAVYGTIFGTVTDKTGAVVPNAAITVTDITKGTSVTAQTNNSGEFRVQHLIPDSYRVEAEASGFAKTMVDNIAVFADTAPKVDLQLAVGSAAANNVVVNGGVTLLETDRAEVSTILNERAVENLPNLNRNFTAFELLTPGTSFIGWSVGEGSGNPQRSQQIEVNGQLPFATGYELDGTDNQEPLNGVAVINPNLDAVSEMKVTSQNYDAEFGKAVAGLVTAQTKSGSNSFHGSAFEFRRSDAQQARDPFANATRDPLTGKYLAPTLHNQFGGSVGGPIKKDRVFFFGDYQGLREKTGTALLTTVPTATALTSCTSGGACDLSDYLQGGQGQIYRPNTLNDTSNTGRTPYVGNIIPAADLSPAAVNFFKLLPKPNVAGAGIINNYAASGSGIFNTNQFDARVDSTLSQKLHVFGRYTYFGAALSGNPYFGAAGGLGFGAGGFAGTDSARDQSVAAGGDYVVSQSWLTDFRFGYYRIHNSTVGPNANQPLGNSLGIPNANVGDLSLNGGLPQFNIDIPSNGSNGGQNIEYGTSANPNLQETAQYQIVNNWSHSMGNHAIKFGADYRYGTNHTVSVASNALRSGTFFFAAPRTAGTAADGTTSTGVGFGTFLLGDTTTFWRTQTQNVAAATRQNRFFTYVQDQWRITPRLTANYGIRWELYTPESVTQKGAGGLLNLTTGILGIAGYGSNSSAINVKNNFTNFAPRLGIAYQLTPRSVFRAGYGIVYGQGWAGNTFGGVLTSSFPTQVQQTDSPVSNSAAVFNLSQGPPGYTFPAIPANGNYVLPDGISQTARPTQVRLPTVAGWNVMYQQELTSTMSLQIGYVGSQSYHNMFESSPSYDANQQTLAGFGQINPTTGQLYTTNERRPFYDGTAQRQLGVRYGVPHQWTQRIDYMANQATGSYNALQVVFNKRYASGLQFLTHYTWSHAIGHEAYEFLIDPKIGRGNGYYNRRNAFVFAGNYDLPFGRDKQLASNVPGWVNQIIGGFLVNGTVTADGGLPFTTNYSSCNSDQDLGICYLNKTGGSFQIKKGSYNPQGRYVPYFKPSPYVLQSPGQANNSFGGFARPAMGTFGNIGRDALWGPGLVNVDASVTKSFSLRENLRMQLTAQAFNVFNHVNLNQPDSCVDCQDTNGVGVQNAGTIQGTVSSQDGTSMRRLQFAARFQF
jgi:hypothetical protein